MSSCARIRALRLPVLLDGRLVGELGLTGRCHFETLQTSASTRLPSGPTLSPSSSWQTTLIRRESAPLATGWLVA